MSTSLYIFLHQLFIFIFPLPTNLFFNLTFIYTSLHLKVISIYLIQLIQSDLLNFKFIQIVPKFINLISIVSLVLISVKFLINFIQLAKEYFSSTQIHLI
jgi:hypothetical protein